MPWHRFTDDEGREQVVHLKMSGQPKVCAECGFLSTRLCDAKLTNGRTCDRSLCDRHATRAGADVDYCRDHAHFAMGTAQPLFEG